MDPRTLKSAPTVALAAALLAATALAGCEVGPNYHRPPVETPPAFKEAQGWTPARPSDGVDRGDWWAMFDDPVLDGLERKVEVSNQNLAAAEAAYREARALVAEQRANLFPTVNLTASATRSGRSGGNAGAGGGAGGAGAGAGGGTGNNFQVQLGASWAPDIWGKVRRAIEGAKASAQLSAADLANARLTAQSELAADYIGLRIADAQKALLQAAVDADQRSLDITQNQYTAGVAAKSDVLQAKTVLDNAKASLVDIDQQRADDEHAIAVLDGEPPADLTIAPDPAWKPTVPETPIALPSTMLERRPDVAAAERNAASASAQIGVQTAGFFPNLTISADGGFASSVLSTLFKSANSFWSIGANATQVVFDAGATGARVRGAKAAYDQAVAQYRQTSLSAFQQVEDDLVAARVLQDEQPLRAAATADANQAEQISLNQYRAGQVAYTQVVITETAALNARQTLLALEGQRMTTAISLVEALGGGWSATQLPKNP
ncbi:MAG TPA: efflux transporter outer membrane subunit [Caulobacteraceae bacterium]|nr:efflux transporter outer membrane subunit [Caulobacteraceae bacterium]